MNEDLLAELKRLSSAERIQLVHDLWDSVSSGAPSPLNVDLLKLTAEERIALAMDLWDSIAPEDVPPPTPEQIAEIEREWAEHERDPGSALSWEEVRARLRSRYV